MTFTDKQMDVFRGQREVTELVPERVSFDGRGGSQRAPSMRSGVS